MKHTPGPWEIDKIQDYDHQITISSKIGFIASAETMDAIEETSEERANARLIASAPDLLEACQLVERAHVGDGVDMAVAVDTCLLAIKKATE